MRLARERNTKVGYFQTSTTSHPDILILFSYIDDICRNLNQMREAITYSICDLNTSNKLVGYIFVIQAVRK